MGSEFHTVSAATVKSQEATEVSTTLCLKKHPRCF